MAKESFAIIVDSQLIEGDITLGRKYRGL